MLLVAKDQTTVEAVQASGLALGVEVEVAWDAEALARRWRGASLRLVSPEGLGRVQRLPSLPETVLVGREAGELAVASAALRCPVILLPGGSSQLADLLAGATEDALSSARVVAVLAASGGVGVSTLALGLALHAQRRREPTALVELAPCGGGLDLLAGCEAADGLRWSGLASARGELGGIDDGVVDVDGLAVLALDRSAAVLPDAQGWAAVSSSLARSRRHIVVDAGREPLPGADVQVLVVPADVRGVAAARMLASGKGWAPDAVVVRSAPGRRIHPSAVSDSLGLPLAGVLRHEPRLPRAAELGHHPLAVPLRRFHRDVAKVWEAL